MTIDSCVKEFFFVMGMFVLMILVLISSMILMREK
jgi:hypothetical protein